ncbi:MAG: leucine-rich repeat protein, partial [Lachnospiraceae bacterium]|nr:leucine-rich repeat protein [Lachnospiraceae bacterium]
TIEEEGGGTATYLVNGNNELENCNIDGVVYTLTLPEYIGPNYIKAIGARAFTDICSLVMVTIPSTLEEIGEEAFKGCHNLQYVYFESDTVRIGDRAFLTQDTTTHGSESGIPFNSSGEYNHSIAGRTFVLYDSAHMTAANKPKIQLYFVGTIDSSATPYQYAMSYSGRFNNASQSPSFARFLSGYPTCQEIEFVLDSATGTSGKATLVDFPIKSDTADLYNPANPKTSYLTLEQKAAI